MCLIEAASGLAFIYPGYFFAIALFVLASADRRVLPTGKLNRQKITGKIKQIKKGKSLQAYLRIVSASESGRTN